MKQVIQNLKSGKTEVVEVPVPSVKEGMLLVRTAASLVSAGTERNLVDFAGKGLIGKARSRPDLLRQLIQKAEREGVLTAFESAINRLDQPLLLGYSSAGTVIETGAGVTRFQPGDRVACAGGGFAVHAEYAVVPQNLAAHIPDSVGFESGAFTTVGAIALNGIRLANPRIGETACVIGLGLLGLITAQLLEANGCNVVGSDISNQRIKFAKNLGVTALSNEDLEESYLSQTNGMGFDQVLICADTASDETVRLAGKISRDRAQVVAIGAVGMDLPRKLYYEKELFFQVSRSYGPGRYDDAYELKGVDYPPGYVRWTEGRNLSAFIGLLESGKIDVTSLVTHRFPISDAVDAYNLITGKSAEEYLGVLLTYPEAEKTETRRVEYRTTIPPASEEVQEIRLGIIGAGNYANAVFLPVVNRSENVKKIGIAATSGTGARHAAGRYKFDYATSDAVDIISDETINTIAILTRHHTHAILVLDAIQNGRHVYCEKPLGIKVDEIRKIEDALSKQNHPHLMVGYNRRFAPFSIKLKQFFDNRHEPMYLHYRVNAGYLPPNHWLNDPETGGGRLIGEGCHFIDFACFLADQIPTKVNTEMLPDIGKYSGDNFLVTMHFPDGSIANISYLANGSPDLSKEYLEVFSGGRTAILNDFRLLELFGQDGKDKFRSWLKQDKGHANAWQAFAGAVIGKEPDPINIQDLIDISYTILACDASGHSGRPVMMNEFKQH